MPSSPSFSDSDDFHDRLRARLRRVLRRALVADALAREISLLTSALATFRGRRSRVLLPDAVRAFTLHERAGYGGILVALLLVVVVEMTVAHLLLAPGHPRLAAVLLVLGVYGVVWLFGDYQAMRRRPCVVGGGELRIRLGLRKELRVPRDQVRSLEALAGEEPRAEAGYARCTPFGPPEHVLRFHRPVRLEEMYKPQREVSALGLTLDDEAGFRALLSL